MTRLLLRPVLCAAMLALPVHPPRAASSPGTLLVGMVSGAPAPLIAGSHRTSYLALSHTDVIAVGDVASALGTYRALPGVAWVEPDRRVHIADAPNDPSYPAQWTLQASSSQPWGLDWQPVFPAVQGAGALVAIVDTGYALGGSDQAAHIRMDLARSFVAGSPTASDDNGHGTFTGNEIAEATNNGIGVASIAPEASIVPVKALDATGAGDLSWVAAGIDYAASIGARVINLSLAGDESAALCAAVDAASRTAIVVAASGNDASPASTAVVGFPAACPKALAVGSVASDGTRPTYANTGCALDVVAPGGDELNWRGPPEPPPDAVIQQAFDPASHTFPYFAEIGTSMASAQVAGEAALLVGLGASPAQVRRTILSTTRDAGPKGFDPTFGAGAVDIAAAVRSLQAGAAGSPPLRGYRTVTTAGAVSALDGPCESGFAGSVASPLARPIVGMAATPSGHGYWLVASDGGIFNFGDAAFYGSTGALHLNQPIVGMAATPSGHGYLLVASDGGMFAYGDAVFRGSTGSIVLNRPIVGMAPTGTGRGYWLVASDGGIFNFGDAAFHGSTGSLSLVSPIVGIAPTSDGGGYALAAGDGGIFTFGDAPFYGAAPRSAAPVVGFVPEPWPAD
ncbi:MAG: S8 family serine peptidase [Acidimicrobiales bacterium]